MRHYDADDSVFFDDDYLIKGVAGAVQWKLLRDHAQGGRTEFTNRELRLAAAEIGLPDVGDNLEARLVLLTRRLVDRQASVRLEKVVGHEQGERVVQALERGGARGAAAVDDERGEVAQVSDRLGVVHVLGRDARRGAGACALECRVHELVLVGQVHLAQREQTFELGERGGDVVGIGGVGAADARERARHEQAQRLVDAGVEVAPAGGRGGGGVAEAGGGECGVHRDPRVGRAVADRFGGVTSL